MKVTGQSPKLSSQIINNLTKKVASQRNSMEKRLIIEELMWIDSRNSYEDSVDEKPYEQQSPTTIETNRDS